MGFGDFVKNQFIDVIEYVDASFSKTLVVKYSRPGNEIKQGAQLIVRNGQAAVFVHRGQIADIFGPGNYKLNTGNLPLLSALAAVPYLFNSPIFKLLIQKIYGLQTKYGRHQEAPQYDWCWTR